MILEIFKFCRKIPMFLKSSKIYCHELNLVRNPTGGGFFLNIHINCAVRIQFLWRNSATDFRKFLVACRRPAVYLLIFSLILWWTLGTIWSPPGDFSGFSGWISGFPCHYNTRITRGGEAGRKTGMSSRSESDCVGLWRTDLRSELNSSLRFTSI